MSKKPMQKFMDWLQYKVTPAVQKFTERPWVRGFSAGIVKCLPFILTGCLIFFYNVVQPYFPNILPNLSAVSNYTFSMLSLLVAFMMVYQEMGSLKHRNYQVVGGLTGICAEKSALCGHICTHAGSVSLGTFNGFRYDLHTDQLTAVRCHGKTNGAHAAVEVQQQVVRGELGILGRDAVELLSGQCVDLIERQGTQPDGDAAEGVFEVARAIQEVGLAAQNDIGVFCVDIQ